MTKLISFFITIFITSNIIAQTDNYSTAIDHFQTNYNNQNYNEIFESFSTEMKQALPLENTRQFIIGLKAQVGNMQRKEFIQYQQGTYATYKTTFEKAILAVNISLDNQNKVNGLFIKPFEEPKKIESKIVNVLHNYPKEIAEILYSKSKDFPNNTQLSIAVIQAGKTNYYGIIKKNDSIKPILNQNKVFEICSITKVFTATVLASLATDKKIKLTDHIHSYYPFTFKDGIKISFQSLANHTSGLPRLPENLNLVNENDPYKNYGKSELEEYLKNMLKPRNDSLKNYAYSNLGAGLLGHTLGLSQKSSFSELLQKRVFDKYNMNQSYTNFQNLGNNLVKGFNPNGEKVSNWHFDVLFGGGGILSTTADLAKFAQAQLNPKNKELALTRKATAVVNENMKIGLGWHLLNFEKEEELIWHNGATGGYTSSLAININRNIAVIILSNVSAFHPKMASIDSICFELIKSSDINQQ
ncbi:MAG: serine hydrolase [Ginsengibacter sp.]